MDNETTDTHAPKVIVKTKTSNVARVAWFLMGCAFSAVLLWQVPSSADIAINVVDNVVTKTPALVSGAAAWVSDTAASIGSE